MRRSNSMQASVDPMRVGGTARAVMRSRWRSGPEDSRKDSRGKGRKPKASLAPPAEQTTDLLHYEGRLGVDADALYHQLDLAFLGRESETILDQIVSESEPDRPGWNADLFADDLFVADLVKAFREVVVGNQRHRFNTAFLERVLTRPPEDREEIRFRQAILEELDDRPEILQTILDLYGEIGGMVSLFRAPGVGARLDLAAFQLDTLQQIKNVIDAMAAGFEDAESGLRRICEGGRAIQESEAYAALEDLLEFEGHLATAAIDVRFAADGRIRSLVMRDVRENRENRYHRRPLGRLFTRFRSWYHGFRFSRSEILSQAIYQVFERIAPAVVALFQLMAHLETYLFARELRRQAAEKGLEMGLGNFSSEGRLLYEGLFNPLLLVHGQQPVPCRIDSRRPTVTLITGANSGGKTRLLQALGLTQLLGQSGLYAPVATARLEVARGCCVSLVEREVTDQTEGRLGRELARIRRLFEEIRPGSLVILDELCSGTNPSEGTEVFEMVLRLLPKLGPTAFICTHFLDFAHRLASAPPVPELSFLRAEVDEADVPTYQFAAGVAGASLAAMTARRLGVNFEELSLLVNQRLRAEGLATVEDEALPVLSPAGLPAPGAG